MSANTDSNFFPEIALIQQQVARYNEKHQINYNILKKQSLTNKKIITHTKISKMNIKQKSLRACLKIIRERSFQIICFTGLNQMNRY